MEKFTDFLTESSLSILYRKYKEYDSGTISAYRGTYSKEENKFRTLSLKTDLIKLGYSITAIDGIFIEDYGTPKAHELNERSFIVFDRLGNGLLEEDLFKLGKKYEQESITYCNVKEGVYTLIGTSNNGYPGYKKRIKLGNSMFGKKGECYSKINGRPLIFETFSLDAINYDCTRTTYNISTMLCLRKMEGYILPE